MRITVYAGPGQCASELPSVRDWSEHGPEEALRRIGLEYKQADYFSRRQVVIVIDPDRPQPEMDTMTRETIRALAERAGVL